MTMTPRFGDHSRARDSQGVRSAPPHLRERQRAYDQALYEKRSGVERFFGRIKHFATRYDKLAVNLMRFITLAATCQGSNSEWVTA